MKTGLTNFGYMPLNIAVPPITWVYHDKTGVTLVKTAPM